MSLQDMEHYEAIDKCVTKCILWADFGGLWSVQPDHNPICVKSRTGFIIMFTGYSITCVMKFHTHTNSSEQNRGKIYCIVSIIERTYHPLINTSRGSNAYYLR